MVSQWNTLSMYIGCTPPMTGISLAVQHIAFAFEGWYNAPRFKGS